VIRGYGARFFLMHEPFDDPVLGRVEWNAKRKGWDFNAGPVAGRPIPASYDPADYRLPPTEHGWDGVRACVLWVRANEPSARAYLTEQLFDGWLSGWYDEEIDEVNSPEGFRDALSLSGINFYDDQEARLIYNDGGLFGGHGFSLQVNAAGQFVAGPDMFG
jgi:hypothetical protein